MMLQRRCRPLLRRVDATIAKQHCVSKWQRCGKERKELIASLTAHRHVGVRLATHTARCRSRFRTSTTRVHASPEPHQPKLLCPE